MPFKLEGSSWYFFDLKALGSTAMLVRYTKQF